MIRRPVGARSALATEAHASVSLVLGGLLLLDAAGQAGRAAGGWVVAAGVLALAGAAALAAGVLPWVWPRVPAPWRRSSAWSAAVVGTVASLTAAVVIDAAGLAGGQLALLGAATAELSGRRRVLTWWWASVGFVVVATILYFALAPVRPTPD